MKSVKNKTGAVGTRTVVTAISVEPELLKLAKMKAELMGYKFSFSRYVSDLFRRDIQCQQPQ